MRFAGAWIGATLICAACAVAAIDTTSTDEGCPAFSIDWTAHSFHPVINMPATYEVMDLTQGPSAHGYGISDNVSYVCRGWGAVGCRKRQWGVGRWCEHRPNMYGGAGTLFDDSTNCLEGFCGARVVHMAIDLGAPVGTPVHAFWEGEIEHVGFQEALGDTGHTWLRATGSTAPRSTH